TDDLRTHALVTLELLDELIDNLARTNQRNAAARNNALFDSRASRMHRILNARLLLLHLGLGSRTDLDDGHAADQLRQPLLQLLAVVVRGGLLDLRANLLHAALDLAIRSAAIDDRRVVLVDGDALRRAQVLDLHALELDAEILSDGFTASQNSDVLEHGLAAVAEARSLHRSHIQRATQLVDYERRQRLTVHVLCNNQQRLGGARNLLQQRQQVLHRRNLLLVDEDVGVLQNRLHALCIGHEVGRQVAAVELHALDHIQLRLHRARLFNRDHAILADLLHRLGDNRADRRIRVRRDRAHLRNHLAAHGLRKLVERAADNIAVLVALADDGLNRLVDAALQRHRVCAGRNRLHALAIDRLRKHGRRGGAVSGNVRGLRSNL